MEAFKSQHKDNSKAWWDERFSKAEGRLSSKEPSRFILSHLDELSPKAKIVEIATGEGRNAVALALKGFDVLALDFSAVALERAERLAQESGATGVKFKSLDLDFYLPELLTFDAIVSVDFRPAPTLLKNLARGLKQNGFLLMESYLIEACKQRKDIEVFETFKPNELLGQLTGSSSFRILKYSEIDEPQKVQVVARKMQLF